MSGKTGFKLDENGNCLITLEAICREVWLHHGQIRMKWLMSIFSIKSKKSEERENVLKIRLMTADNMNPGNFAAILSLFSG